MSNTDYSSLKNLSAGDFSTSNLLRSKTHKTFLFIGFVPFFVLIFLILVMKPSALNTSQNKTSEPEKISTNTTEQPPKTTSTNTSSTTYIKPTGLPSKGEYGYITSNDGLVMRKSPSKDAKKTGFIDSMAIVKVIDDKGPAETLYDKASNWIVVDHKGDQGWVFGGFVQKDPTRELKQFQPSKIEVSSILPKSKNYNYDPTNLFDGKFDTIWGTKGFNGNESIEMDFGSKINIIAMRIYNGFGVKKWWSKSSRAKEMTVYCDSIQVLQHTLVDTDTEQLVEFSKLENCAKLRLNFTSRYTAKGDKDMYLSEIAVFGK